ncbi:unnamed protein product [Rotaria sordida]|uniref:Uncharacterized protein n=1 Tax=Rotaria sordida TaxID=392033 RepID=A0A814SUS1_9BILA|nr:unnamed protein product [Rotaria sordida]CAF1217422.1 unnamed protein product [Rotaria sordida]CAF1219955.1 unnamed protein product [Rotaria sordida]CAF1495817.1 unnamed protein product [Rotaria sordida]CAF1499678.1 unnamed protein product [Rotaria sordida]
MVITTINMERDVRRRYNRRVLFCLRIKGAALFIGFWDLFIHLVALCAIIFIMFGLASDSVIICRLKNNELYDQVPKISIDNYHKSSSEDIINNKNFLSKHSLLNRILEKRNMTRPLMEMNPRHFYSYDDFMTFHWIQSLSQRDKCIVFVIIFSVTMLILAHICGVITNKPSYIVPYFLIKVFNVIIAILTMLGFYAYLPDIKAWLQMQSHFPYKNYLLEFDGQTLQLLVFTSLLFLILVKLYIVAIIWYCYGYITALTMARTIGTFTTYTDVPQPIIGEMYSPPKYEEAIKSNPQQQEHYSPPPYTPLLSS